jgi:hypothetical protein
MFQVSRLIAPLALAVGVAVAATACADPDGNQPPFGKGFQPPFGKFGRDEKKTDRKGEKKAEPGDRKGPPKSDPTVDAWVKVCLEKITDPHDTVRDSARAAILAVGPAAIPALEKLAEGGDPAKVVAAQKLITAIRHGPHGPGPQGPAFGPRGPMNPMNPRRPDGNRPNPNATLERLLGDLQLNEKQQKGMQEALEVHGKKLREFSEQLRDGKIDRKDVPEAMEKLQKELLADVKKVLSEEQFKKLQERLPNGRFPFPTPFGQGERPKRDE